MLAIEEGSNSELSRVNGILVCEFCYNFNDAFLSRRRSRLSELTVAWIMQIALPAIVSRYTERRVILT